MYFLPYPSCCPYFKRRSSPSYFLLLIAALPTTLPNNSTPALYHRVSLPVQPCGYNEMWPYGAAQTNQPDCNAAATEMCNFIPSAAWRLNEWTKVDSGTCRTLVYHADQMPVPTVDDCMQTFAGNISTCIVQLPGKNDDGSANRNEEDVSKVEQDPSVYQIGSRQYYGRKF